MKQFARGVDGDFFAVIKDESLWYRVAVFTGISIMFHGENAKPFHIHKGKFETREMAEVICEMLAEEYSDGHGDGQASCY